MAEWLQRVVEEVDRQFQELPEWKRNTEQANCSKFSSDEGRSASTIQEPRSE
jgi:hypothetical protein